MLIIIQRFRFVFERGRKTKWLVNCSKNDRGNIANPDVSRRINTSIPTEFIYNFPVTASCGQFCSVTINVFLLRKILNDYASCRYNNIWSTGFKQQIHDCNNLEEIKYFIWFYRTVVDSKLSAEKLNVEV